MENPVGPILRMSDTIEEIISAIEDDNPGREIEVIDRGAYVRVHASSFLKVTAESLKRYLGPNYQLRSLENLLTANAGRINTSRSDQTSWSLGGATEEEVTG